MALLVDAWNRCGLPHADGEAALTVADLKREIRELDLWCSSCMVAFDAKEPIGVLIGCKRPPHTLVHRIAVRPDHLRQGHGRHMLTSLSGKLAILGPPHLLAEVPAGNRAARALFSACGWREERTYVDFVCDAPASFPAPPGLIVPVTVDDLADIALPSTDAPRSWCRTSGTLLHRQERLAGLAIASGDRLEASVLYTREDDGTTALWNLSVAEGAEGEAAMRMLLKDLANREHGRLEIRRIHDDEISVALLCALGFKSRRETIGLVSEAMSRG